MGPERPATLSGSLEAVSALDLLDWLCTNRKSWTLRVFSEGAEAQAVVLNGELLHAQSASQQGLPALAEIVGYRRGYFDLAPVADTTRRSLRGHWRSLLLGAAQLADGQYEAEASEDELALGELLASSTDRPRRA